MSFSPESFDRLLAEKLAQAPAPTYEPAHWDQLEDQLQHLNSALQQAANPAAGGAGVGAPAAAPLAGKLAVLGFGALLTGLTAINGYFFYATSKAREQSPAPLAAPARVSPSTPEPVVAEVIAPTAVPTAPVAAPSRVVRVPRPKTKAAPTPTLVPRFDYVTAAAPATVNVEPAAVPPSAAPTVAAPVSSVAARVDSASSFTRPAGELSAIHPLLTVPNVITPNGDGLNDRFELPLPAGTCRLTVFDRANRVVFSAERYDNAWDGGTLPAGIYVFLIETNGDARLPPSGTLSIIR